MLGGLPASPELLARVDALRPADDVPDQSFDDAMASYQRTRGKPALVPLGGDENGRGTEARVGNC